MAMNTMTNSAISNIARDLRQLVAIRSLRKERTKTISSALVLVNKRHPTFNSLGFDENFLQNEGADLMESFIYGGPVPNAEELASLWVDNFSFMDRPKQELVERVLPMMTDFVYILGTEAGEVPDAARSMSPVTAYTIAF